MIFFSGINGYELIIIIQVLMNVCLFFSLPFTKTKLSLSRWRQTRKHKPTPPPPSCQVLGSDTGDSLLMEKPLVKLSAFTFNTLSQWLGQTRTRRKTFLFAAVEN